MHLRRLSCAKIAHLCSAVIKTNTPPIQWASRVASIEVSKQSAMGQGKDWRTRTSARLAMRSAGLGRDWPGLLDVLRLAAGDEEVHRPTLENLVLIVLIPMADNDVHGTEVDAIHVQAPEHGQ